MLDQKSRIQHVSELSAVFEAEELKKAFVDKESKEVMYSPSQIITTNENKGDCVFFVARGMIIEKNGQLDDHQVPQIKFNKGDIACLQNLLPGSENLV